MKGFDSGFSCLSCDLLEEDQRRLAGLYVAKVDHMNNCLVTAVGLITLMPVFILIKYIFFSRFYPLSLVRDET